MIIFQNDYLTLEQHPDTNTLISTWCRSVSPAEYRKGLLNIIDAAVHFHSFFWLQDNRLLNLLEMAEQRWTIETLSKEIPNTNFKRIACVVPEEVFHQIICFKIHSALKEEFSGLEFDVFTESFVALRWLIAVKENSLRF